MLDFVDFFTEVCDAVSTILPFSLLHIFEGINRQGQTILMVTHSTRAASHAGRVLFIKDGIVYHQLYRGNLTVDQFYQKIVDTLTLITTGGRTNA